MGSGNEFMFVFFMGGLLGMSAGFIFGAAWATIAGE